MAARPAAKPAQPRNNGLAQIHIAKAQLGMADDTYRQVLWAVARVHSAKDLDHAGRQKVLDHFKRCGWKPAPPKAAAKGAQGPLPMPKRRDDLTGPGRFDAQLAKASALWGCLAAAGVVKNGSDAALMAYVERQTGSAHWRWLNGHQCSTVIESLKRWCARSGVAIEQ